MYAPSSGGHHKVYIVDEAHMLTREAWNALLKILEEPPPRVVFVFATTEPQKIAASAAPDSGCHPAQDCRPNAEEGVRCVHSRAPRGPAQWPAAGVPRRGQDRFYARSGHPGPESGRRRPAFGPDSARFGTSFYSGKWDI